MSVRKYALCALFTLFAGGTALAQDSTMTDTTMTDTTMTDSTGDSLTGVKYGVRFSELGLKIVGSGFTVSLQTATPVTFRVLDVFGRTVWTQTVTPSEGLATTSWRGVSSGGQPLGRGTYVLQALTAQGAQGAVRTPLGARTVILGR